MVGSGSDGTEDSDSSAEREQTNSSESDGNMPKRQRLTRASTRLSQSSQGRPTSYKHNIKFCISPSCLINVVVWLYFQILRTWSERRTMMSLHHWRPQVMPPLLNPSWTSPAPMPPMTRARPKIKPAETQIRTSPIDPSAAAATRPTTSTWNAPLQDATHSVRFINVIPDYLIHWIWFVFSDTLYYHHVIVYYKFPPFLNLPRSPHRKTWTSFCCIRLPSLPQSLCWWMQGKMMTIYFSYFCTAISYDEFSQHYLSHCRDIVWSS